MQLLRGDGGSAGGVRCRGWRGAGVEAGELTRADKDPGKHGPVQAAGVGVAQRRVVAGEQVEAVRKGELGAVREAKGGAGGDDAGVEQIGEVGFQGDPAEGDDDAEVREGGELVREVFAAVANLVRAGLVGGRSAADGGGDPGMAEREAVVAASGLRAAGEAELMEDGEEEVAGAIAGKGPPGAVGAVRSGSEAEKEDARAGIAEAGNGLGPVRLVEVGAAAGFAERDAVRAQAGAALAADDLLGGDLELSEFGRGAHAHR